MKQNFIISTTFFSEYDLFFDIFESFFKDWKEEDNQVIFQFVFLHCHHIHFLETKRYVWKSLRNREIMEKGTLIDVNHAGNNEKN